MRNKVMEISILSWGHLVAKNDVFGFFFLNLVSKTSIISAVDLLDYD